MGGILLTEVNSGAFWKRRHPKNSNYLRLENYYLGAFIYSACLFISTIQLINPLLSTLTQVDAGCELMKKNFDFREDQNHILRIFK